MKKMQVNHQADKHVHFVGEYRQWGHIVVSPVRYIETIRYGRLVE